VSEAVHTGAATLGRNEKEPASMKISSLVIIAAMTLTFTAPPAGDARAGSLPTPEGTAILTVSGAISEVNDGDTAKFDLAMLKAMPQADFSTSTIWTEGEHRFSGISLQDLLAAVGATGTSLQAVALNDYSIQMPVSDAVDGGPIVAILMDGAEMSPREKGPLWIVYPYDSDSAYQSEVIYSRSIWQLARIEILD
jgi:hypothetical protein